MTEQPEPKRGSDSPNQISDDVVREFLRSEYTVSNEWAMHGENLSHRIFSFFITLVTATLGGALAIGQGISESMQSSFLILGAACLILLFAGPVFFEALFRDHIRNVSYRRRMLTLQALLAKGAMPSENNANISGSSTDPTLPPELQDPYHPSAVPHTLVGLINSLLVGLSIPALLWGIAGPGYKLLASLASGLLALILSFFFHRLAARLMARKYLDV